MLLSLSFPAIISRALTWCENRNNKDSSVLTPSQSAKRCVSVKGQPLSSQHLHSLSSPFWPIFEPLKNNHKKVSFVFLKILPGDRTHKTFTCQYCLLLGGVNVKLMFSRQLLMAFCGQRHIPGQLWHFMLCSWGCQRFPITACQNNKLAPAYLEQPA